MNIILPLVYLVLVLFQLALILRIVYDAVQMFARQWRPKGPALVLATAIYGVTDPPVRLFRRIIPPLRLGGVALDLAFLVLFIIVSILTQIVAGVAR
ncbi:MULTISPECIES: YggT family protein [unclassified Arthrobacter]|uniref:YggT family protein n=1 Tax=unclassified Arthrobacter TaxID=235627 RepID=UPI001D15DEA8|nr:MULTISPECIES: YggT family protein [unclassified Arthrobacter]MCC3279678.1 YggT family protein [Arthrobacter sp. zg-Y40]MCC9178079.1 YggT family protein [Arthrobacter sp. zg-Y750]MCC3274328.1 YggT family protein [Arthrobacter sp. zg-Y20]MDK1314484.1 YggT family protein [Arthrobacter sp. zg.Y20]MDK1327370.1 YggT family protein [Arthrobacter sp. zg-Y1143]